MPVVKIKNYHSNRYLDCQSEDWSTLTAIPTQQVVTNLSDDSLSQRWYIESYSGTIHIRTCLDANYGITRFENSVTHQCGITKVDSYEDMSNNPFAPEIVLEPAYSGHYRIKLAGSNMYLTELTYPSDAPYASWGGYSDVGETKNRQIWLIQTVTDCNTLTMPQNVNQKYTGNPELSSGCGACCVMNIAAYYKGGAYTYDDLSDDKVVKEGFGVVKNYNACSYCSFSEDTSDYTFATIKSEIDNSHPVMISIGHYTSNTVDSYDNLHYVTAYGYINSCNSSSDVLVLDSANPDSTKPIGLYRTLSQAYASVDNATAIGFIKTTSPK